MKSQAFFQDIRHQLLQELKTAEESIVVAMAWFTDKKLFRELVDKASAGVSVKLLLAQDDINRDHGPDFSVLENAGGEFTWVHMGASDNIMHNKFCVIDGSTVITGSYNWTNRANSNHENITVHWEAEDLASMFIEEFNRLSTLYGGSSTSTLKQFDYAKIASRLQLIKFHLSLNEFNEIDAQIQKIKKFELIEEVEEILTLLEKSFYTDALVAIEKLHKRYSALISLDAERIHQLRMEIRYLEIEYGTLLEHRDLLSRTIDEFRHIVRMALGELIRHLLELKIAWYKIREKMGFTERFEDLKDEYDAFEEELNRDRADNKPTLSEEDEATIRELYKRGVKLCHPDMVLEEHKEKAHDIFIRLKAALDRNDLKEVQYIVESLEAGIWDLGPEVSSISELERLESMLQDLRLKVEQIRREVKDLAEADDYLEMQKYATVEEYIQLQKVTIEKESERLSEKINEYKNGQFSN